MNSFLVEVSARHVHLNDFAVKTLFGENYNLTFKKELSQIGQFVCNEKICVVGEKGSFKTVSVLGPTRKEVQIELSKTDAIKVGINAPIKESGDLKNSGACKLIGPKGELFLKQGVIIAKRHIHANEQDAANLKVKNGDVVFVNILTEQRSLIFKDVVVRVSNNFNLAMHIDTDEANAANVLKSCKGEIFKTN